jgi:hypothetical protein
MEDAKDVAVRFFMFSARRGIGVFYGSFSVFVMVSFFISVLSNSLLLLLVFWVLGGFGVWYVSRVYGFRSFGRMRYTMILLENIGKKENVRSFNPGQGVILFMISFWPWILFIALILLGYPKLAVLFPLIWVFQLALLWLMNFRKEGEIEIGFKLEDWTFLLSLAIAAILVIVPGMGLMGFVYAVPVFIFSSVRSLFKAPEELLLEHEAR